MFKKTTISILTATTILLLAIVACASPVLQEAPQPSLEGGENIPAEQEGEGPQQANLSQQPIDESLAERQDELGRKPGEAPGETLGEEPAAYPAATAMALPAGTAKMGQSPSVMQPVSPYPTLAPANGRAYADNFFENYGVNPLIDTEDDHLSTFALDVDTGSYTVARKYIQEGSLPDPDGVRVEEFVNYFPQGYRYPSEREAFAIYMDGAPSPFTQNDRYHMLRVGVQGYAVERSKRMDAALTFVIDISGSMDMENRLGLVKQSLEYLVEQLRPTDTVSIVVYGSEARILLQPTRGNDQGAILEAIHSLQPEGSTNAQAGLNLGYRMALRAFNAEGINRVILCSDGVANVGDTSAEEIWQTVKARASEGITLTTVGFGMGNYNDVLMEQLADNGNGFYAYVDTLSEARRLFVENLTSTLQVIGMNAKIQVDFNPRTVARYRLVGFENRAVADEDFRNNKVDAGEIGAGHAVTALYEVKLRQDAYGEVARTHLRWEDPQTHTVREIERGIAGEEFARSFQDASPYFRRDVVVAEFAEILRHSYWAQNSNLAAVLEEIQGLEGRLEEDNDQREFADLVRRAYHLQAEGQEFLDP